MKNLKIKINLLLIVTAITFVSCKKESPMDNNPVVNPPTSTTNTLTSFFEDNESTIEQKFTKDASTHITIYGNKGTKIYMQPNSLEKMDGSAVTGNIEIELIEIMDKQTMLLTNKSTNGRKSDGDIATLISGGEIKLNATQGGDQLKLKSGYNYTVLVPSNPTTGFDADMNKFDGNLKANNGIVWENEDKTAIKQVKDTVPGSGRSNFSWTDSTFGWTNIDKFYNDPRPKTLLKVKLPSGYDDNNSSVYISYDGEPMALANMDRYDNATGEFTEHYGLIPVGLKVHFVIVSEVSGQLYSAIVGKTITNNHVETISSMTPTTKSQITADVIALP